MSKLPRVVYDGREPFYVLEGDLRLTQQQVWARINSATPVPVANNSELNVMFRNGLADKWPLGHRSLTFAIDKRSFTNAEYKLIRKNFLLAIPAWTKSCGCGLSITHKPEHDFKPSLSDVTFIVKKDPNARAFYALAFFPNDPRDTRYVIIGPEYFQQIEYDKVGIIRHEIGHVLGYRHSHIGGIEGCEFYEEKDKNWKALSPYDSSSVMHYPCGGGGSPKFLLSATDQRDHRKFYGGK
ncbi:hypothetical protein [Rhizobium yanglingense]